MNIDRFIKLITIQFGEDPMVFSGPLLNDCFPEAQGLTTPEVGAVLNAANRCLDPDEVYLEIGNFKGKSLLLATDGIKNDAVAVDSGGHRDLFWRNQKLSRHRGNLICHSKCFRDFLRLAAEGRPVLKVGTYFYDADHSEAAQYEGLDLVVPLLASSAIVVVDDFNEPFVSNPSNRWATEHPEAKLLWYLPTAHNGLRPWWNGLGIYSWIKQPT